MVFRSPSGAEDTGIDIEALEDWRRKETDAILLVSVALHIPPLLLLMRGYGRNLELPIIETFAVVVGLVLAAALLRGIDYRIRAWTVLGGIYVTAGIGALAFPEGPYIRSLPLVAPIYAIGVLGLRSARIATVISVIFLLATPALLSRPPVIDLLGIDPARVHLSNNLWLAQGLALTMELIVMMVLLQRFHLFLHATLRAKHVAALQESAVNAKLEQAMRERLTLERQMATISDEERRLLASEIHDGVCQQLTGALLRCQAMELRLDRGRSPVREDLDGLASLLGETIREAHAVARGLRPLDSTPEALTAGLRTLARESRQMSEASIGFRAEGNVQEVDPVVAQHLYRIAQEALSNAVRHARAKRISVLLRASGSRISLCIEDDGVGLDGAGSPEGLGFRTMAYRAEIIGGRLEVASNPGGGTRITCSVERNGVADRLHDFQEVETAPS